ASSKTTPKIGSQVLAENRGSEAEGVRRLTDMCSHDRSCIIDTRCFVGPVSDEENPAAHGGITETDECVICGARRAANVNGRHVELGPWGPSRAQREAEERSRREAEERSRREAEERARRARLERA